jgi:DNA-binding beta-propeller fold protein YncE
MDETLLRELFERAIEPEPPIGTVAENGVRAGIRLHRRHRARQAVTGAAAAAVTCTVVAATTLGGGHGSPATPAGGHGGPAAPVGSGAVYVLSYPGAKSPGVTRDVTPISTATNTAGAPIAVVTGDGGPATTFDSMTATPGGKTIYVTDASTAVTPVFTAKGTAGRPIFLPRPRAAPGPLDIMAAPDGKTVYVLARDGELTPVSTVTNTPGTPVSVTPPGTPEGQAVVTSAAITPDGKTLYVCVAPDGALGPEYVIPVDTATGRPGKPIRLAGSADSIVVTPDGRTAYVIGSATLAPTYSPEIAVTAIATATNSIGPAVIAGPGDMGAPVVMTPDGQQIYIATSGSPGSTVGLIPFSTATDTAGKQISFGDTEILALAVAPDGQIVYVASQKFSNGSVQCPGAAGVVTPVVTATNRTGKPVRVACTPYALAVTPDSKTVYVASRYSGPGGAVTPIEAATGLAGTPIEVNGDPRTMLITP